MCVDEFAEFVWCVVLLLHQQIVVEVWLVTSPVVLEIGGQSHPLHVSS